MDNNNSCGCGKRPKVHPQTQPEQQTSPSSCSCPHNTCCRLKNQNYGKENATRGHWEPKEDYPNKTEKTPRRRFSKRLSSRNLIPFIVSMFFISLILMKTKNLSGISKSLPTFSLCLFLLLQGLSSEYRQLIFLGLLFATVADIITICPCCFMWSSTSFVCCYSSYIMAFGVQPPKIMVGFLCGMTGMAAFVIFAPDLKGHYVFLVPIYIKVLMWMAWRAIARYDSTDRAKICACVGSFLLILYECMIGTYVFETDKLQGHSKSIYLYYLGQLGLAVSTTKFSRLKSSKIIGKKSPRKTNLPQQSTVVECSLEEARPFLEDLDLSSVILKKADDMCVLGGGQASVASVSSFQTDASTKRRCWAVEHSSETVKNILKLDRSQRDVSACGCNQATAAPKSSLKSPRKSSSKSLKFNVPVSQNCQTCKIKRN